MTLYTYFVFAFVQKKSGCQPGYCRLIQIDDGNVSEHCFSRLLFYLQKVKRISINGNFDRTIRDSCFFKTKYPTGLDSFDALPVHPDSSNKFVKIFQTKTL